MDRIAALRRIEESLSEFESGRVGPRNVRAADPRRGPDVRDGVRRRPLGVPIRGGDSRRCGLRAGGPGTGSRTDRRRRADGSTRRM